MRLGFKNRSPARYELQKGGLLSIRHSNLRYWTGNLLTNVCNDNEIGPRLLLVTDKKLKNQTVSRSNEARVDIRSKRVLKKRPRDIL